MHSGAENLLVSKILYLAGELDSVGVYEEATCDRVVGTLVNRPCVTAPAVKIAVKASKVISFSRQLDRVKGA
jgi:hypothetical protein